MVEIKLNHIHPVSGGRLFAAFDYKTFLNTHRTVWNSGMITYAYDGKVWFFVGYGSPHHCISEVGCNANKSGGNHYYHSPYRTQLAINYIFDNRNPLSEKVNELMDVHDVKVSEALKSAVREYKLNNILIKTEVI